MSFESMNYPDPKLSNSYIIYYFTGFVKPSGINFPLTAYHRKT